MSEDTGGYMSNDPNFDAKKFAEREEKLAHGLCPNDCGAMTPDIWGQICPKCNFTCNIHPRSAQTMQ